MMAQDVHSSSKHSVAVTVITLQTHVRVAVDTESNLGLHQPQ